MSTVRPTNQQEHTPGPWRAATGSVPSLNIRALGVLKESHNPGETGESICIVCKEDNMEPHDIANAALISAAPDLFACLAPLMERDWFKEGESGQVVCSLDADLVRAALTKAKNFPDGEPMTTANPSPDASVHKNGAAGNLLKPYQVGETINGEFGFKTPTGRSDGFLTRADAERSAAATEKQDRAEAETGIGPIAEVLQKHFAIEDGKAGDL